jgi:hypothetical protein
MELIRGYDHRIAAHCESGSMRNLMVYEGADVSEELVFGIGSGPFFAYLWFVKIMSSFPLIGLRNPPGQIVQSVARDCGIRLFMTKYRTTDEALETANRMLDRGKPVAACVDMFYMTYLPAFMRVHAPAHFIVFLGREGDTYAVSDAYTEKIGHLDERNLRRAWATHAPMAPNNLLYYLEEMPARIDWRRAVLRGIKRTANRMLMMPVVRNLIPFIGIKGIDMFSKKMLGWPEQFHGRKLREGLWFMAATFEENGTGGGAFRMMYGAFLQEVAEMFDSDEMAALAARMVENGRLWRDASRALIRLGKKIPPHNGEYPQWYARNSGMVHESLREISSLYSERAEFERTFFTDLRDAASRLKP